MINDPTLRAWVEQRQERWARNRQELERLTEDWSEGDWAALKYRLAHYPPNDTSRTSDELCVQRFLAKQRKIHLHGIAYDAPYTQALHVAALRERGTPGQQHWTEEAYQ